MDSDSQRLGRCFSRDNLAPLVALAQAESLLVDDSRRIYGCHTLVEALLDGNNVDEPLLALLMRTVEWSQ